LPLIWTEYNADYSNQPQVTDSAYMGPFLANTIRECDGLTEMMSYWTFPTYSRSKAFVKTPFYGGFGILAERSIPKPAFNDFALLHHLGDTRLDCKLRFSARDPPQRWIAGNCSMEPLFAGTGRLAKNCDASLQRLAVSALGSYHHSRQRVRLSTARL